MAVNSDLIRKYGFKFTVKDELVFLRLLFGAFAFFGLEAWSPPAGGVDNSLIFCCNHSIFVNFSF